MEPVVVKDDITHALRMLNICPGDILLLHSSMRSLGIVEGGVGAVVEGVLEAIGPEGTLVVPTLIQKDFANAYRDWNIDRPSDVGYFTEYVRKRPGALRSDQATHSVAALGRYARQITEGHCAFGPRPGVFGPYAFGHSSPWQKLYDLHAKVLFIGVDMSSNTMKHFVEYRQVESRLNAIQDPVLRMQAESGIWRHEDYAKVAAGSTERMWPFYPSEPMTEELDRRGLIRWGQCGSARLMNLDIHSMVDAATDILEGDLSAWYPEHVVRWFRNAERMTACSL